MQPDSCSIFLSEVHSWLSVLVLPNHKQPSHLLRAVFLSNDSDDPTTLSKDVRGGEKPDCYKWHSEYSFPVTNSTLNLSNYLAAVILSLQDNTFTDI